MSAGRRWRRQLNRGPVVFVLPDLAEDLPPRVLEGIARRRLCAITGRCPCGAEMPAVVPFPGHVVHVAMEHEADCPATDDAIGEAMRGHAS